MKILKYFKNPLSKFTRNPISLVELNNRMSNPDFQMKFDISLEYEYPVDCLGGNECFETGEYNIQRSLCWSLEKKQEYIESLLKGTHQGVSNCS